MSNVKNKIKIITQGNMNGTWSININNIEDSDLYKTEVKILKLFKQKKKKI